MSATVCWAMSPRASLLVSRLPPDITHDIARAALRFIRMPFACRGVERRVGRMTVRGPIGIAAGLDKDGSLIGFLDSACPGFLTIGTVLPYPRKGNPRPRLARYRKALSMCNAMGLNTPGLEPVLTRIARSRARAPIVLSIGGFDVGDFAYMARTLRDFPRINAVEINVSSPTYGDRWLNAADRATAAVTKYLDTQLFIKVPYTMSPKLVARLMDEHGVGATAINTLPISEPSLSTGRGGLSGVAVYPVMLRYVKALRAHTDGPIIAVGGICSRGQAMEVLRHADAVAVLTCITYFGPLALRNLTNAFSQ